MPSTTYKGYSIPTTGTLSGTWGTEINNNSFSVIDSNLGGIVNIPLSSVPVTLTAAQAQNLIVRFTGVMTASVLVTVPCQGFMIFDNVTTGAALPSITNGVGTPVTIRQNHRSLLIFDAVNGARLVTDSVMNDLAVAGAIIRNSTNGTYTDACPAAVSLSKDNNGVVLPTGIQGDVYIPFAGAITAATLVSDVAGSMVVDVWRSSLGVYPPTASNSVCGGNKPALVSSNKFQDGALIGWTTPVNGGDIIRFNIDSVSSITRFTIALTVARYI